MATENKAEKTVGETGKSSKISPPFKSSEANTLSPKDGTPSDATSCISSGDATSSTKEGDVDQEMLTNEPCLYYPVGWYGHYYPGSFAEWDDQGYPIGNDGLDLQQAGFPADNSSVLYYAPGLQPEYSTYSPFFPGAVVSPGQYLGQQAYYASPMFPQPVLSPGYFSPSLAYGHDIIPGYWDASYSYGDGNSVIGDSTVPPSKGSLPQVYSPASIKARSKPLNTYEAKKTAPARALSPSSAVNGQTKSMTKVASVLSKSYFPVTKYPSYSNEMKSSILYPCDDLSVKGNGQNLVGDDKPKAQSKAGVGGIDLLDEQNHGPRTNGLKTAWLKGSEPCEDFNASDIDSNPNYSDIVVARDEYNLAEFPSKYEHALFFVIKSYSEDDIHKSIKYNVWASTPSGNQRLDNAFKVAREKMEEKGSKCPVFLFFSVNASGQFCGVAEMIARVDFSKNMDFWQQDKWNGFFPVKWHIIKDVTNAHFRHIILENNDNKPVTNSRDTQEVKFPQGTEMLNIFKSFSSKTSILDDFSFYENRQKAMQKKRVKPKLDDVTQVKKTDDATSLSSAFRALNVSLSGKQQVDELQVRSNAE